MIGATFAAAITNAITISLTADNPLEAVGTFLATTVISLLPTLVSSCITLGATGGGSLVASFIASTAGIGAIILAITAAIVGFIAWLRSSNKEAEENKLGS